MSSRPRRRRRRAGPLERDTSRDLIVPKLHKSGWRDAQIIEERFFTDGRIVRSTFGHRRLPGLRADFLLEPEPDLPVAVVEAKRAFKLPADGLQQAMRYAE